VSEHIKEKCDEGELWVEFDDGEDAALASIHLGASKVHVASCKKYVSGSAQLSLDDAEAWLRRSLAMVQRCIWARDYMTDAEWESTGFPLVKGVN
jgi:hypothetical protein